jgi:hypothetical protein
MPRPLFVCRWGFIARSGLGLCVFDTFPPPGLRGSGGQLADAKVKITRVRAAISKNGVESKGK